MDNWIRGRILCCKQRMREDRRQIRPRRILPRRKQQQTMEVEVNISYEAVGIARAVTSGWMNPERDAAYRDAQKAAQLAINSATATLQKEIERLRGEVEKAYLEGMIDYLCINNAWPLFKRR